MRSALLISLVVFITVVIAGFGLTWFVQAHHMRNSIEQAVNSINAQQPVISYDRMETSGFPQQIVVSLVNPRFKGRVDTLLQQNGLPAWHEDLALAGSVSFAVNAFSDRYTLLLRGDWQQQSSFDSHKLATRTTMESDMLCMLELESGSRFFSHMWDSAKLGDLQEIANRFRSLDCSLPAGKTVAENGGVLFSNAASRFYLGAGDAESTPGMRLFFQLHDSQATPLGDERIRSYYQLIAPAEPMPLPLSTYGKQNIDVDMSYRGPTALEQLQSPDVALDFTIHQFKVANNLSHFELTAQASHIPSGGQRQVKLAFKGINRFNPGYNALFHDMARHFVEQLYAQPTAAEAPFAYAREHYQSGQFLSVIEPAFPDFEALQTVTMGIDLAANLNDSATQGSITLGQLELSAARYGISGKGSATLLPASFPAAEATLHCRDCLNLIDDAVGFALRVETASRALNPPESAAPAITPSLAEGCKLFAQAIGQPGENGTLGFVLHSSAEKGLEINGHDMASVMQLYNQYIEPRLAGAKAERD